MKRIHNWCELGTYCQMPIINNYLKITTMMADRTIISSTIEKIIKEQIQYKWKNTKIKYINIIEKHLQS